MIRTLTQGIKATKIGTLDNLIERMQNLIDAQLRLVLLDKDKNLY